MSFASNEEPQPTKEQRFPSWTGFNGKTLFEWLNLAGVVAVPLFIGLLGALQWYLGETRKLQEERIAEDRRYQEIMSDYLEQMAKLQIEYKAENVSQSPPDSLNGEQGRNDIELMARAFTLNAARQLDGERKGQLLKFLYESDLIGGQCELQPSGELKNCKTEGELQLDGATLRDIINDPDVPLYLPGSDLSHAYLQNAKLAKISLANANMQSAKLQNADLSEAVLNGAVMSGTVLENADLSCAVLAKTSLIGANIKNADFRSTDLSGADLRGVARSNTKFGGALFNEATQFPAGFDTEGQGMLRATEETITQRKLACNKKGRWFSWFW